MVLRTQPLTHTHTHSATVIKIDKACNLLHTPSNWDSHMHTPNTKRLQKKTQTEIHTACTSFVYTQLHTHTHMYTHTHTRTYTP